MSHRRPTQPAITLILLLTALLGLSACAARASKVSEARYAGGAPMDYAGGEAEYAPTRAAAPPMAPPMEEPAIQDPVSNAEDYTDYGFNDFTDPNQDPLSTFSVDVDTASYTIARRKLLEGTLPPSSSVRIEEFINFFKYDYPQPDDQHPFAVDFGAARSPFDPNKTFIRVGLQGKDIDARKRPPVHLVFLVDTSGSMQAADKMGLLKQSLKYLVDNLQPQDTVALATYAGATTKVLDPTSVSNRGAILDAIDRLHAGGSTAMASGLQLAYDMAYQNLKPGHIHRVVVCSDGDANVGPSSHEGILKTIGHYTKEGVTLSTIGFGMGNYKDTMMEQLANQGDGNYYYIDSFKEARRIFGQDMLGTLVVIAKDVKIQVEFDPAVVKSYRLIGYENRDIADKDFRNDGVDAGEIGSGHQVTALYEVILHDDNPTQSPAPVRLRSKAPEGGRSTELTHPMSPKNLQQHFDDAHQSTRLAITVAAFAELLRDSPFSEDLSAELIYELATSAITTDESQQELLSLISALR